MIDHQVNTEQYWDSRFGSGDWESRGGYSQTRLFAEAQVPLFQLGAFTGSLCDFGCGAGDAIPVYRAAFPAARLRGVDFSSEAIRLCSRRFGAMASFVCGSATDVPASDVIVCSNVLEHLEDDLGTVATLLERCRTLIVAVPYRERPLSPEHLRTYDASSFSAFGNPRAIIYKSRGYTQYGYDLLVGTYVKNVARLLLGRPVVGRRLQMLVQLEGHLKPSSDGANG